MDRIPKDIIYFIPRYTSNGDSVEMLLLSGEKKVFEFSIRKFTKNLYSLYAIDEKTLKKLISNKIGQKNILPVILPDATFIPVKIRRPLIKTDPTNGFVNMVQIFRIDKKEDNEFEILFKCGAVLKCIGSPKNFKRRITSASILSDYFSNIWAGGVSQIKEECELENIYKME